MLPLLHVAAFNDNVFSLYIAEITKHLPECFMRGATGRRNEDP